MKRILISLIISAYSLCGMYSFADEWLGISLDIQQKIQNQTPIMPDVRKKIDLNLRWAEQCYEKGLICSTDNEKQVIRELLRDLEGLSTLYAEIEENNVILTYIIGKIEILRAMTQEDVPPMGPVVLETVLQIFYDDVVETYQMLYNKKILAQTTQHQNALMYVPEGITIPNVPLSKTRQAIVIDISDQRLYAFEDDLLIYTSPITSGRNKFGTVKGNFSITKKQRNKLLRSPFKNIYYSLHVDYWIEFYPKYGIHDACNSKSCWRKEFGGQDYKSSGSHGCVNSPYDTVKWVYEWGEVGTAVRVQS